MSGFTVQQRARPRRPAALIGVVVLVVVAAALVGLRLLNVGGSPASSAGATGRSGLPVVRVSSLPPEAQRTIQLIATGGPYPYRQDGITFSNREGILPQEVSGYYREYTVVTPGSVDRGARRVIAGRDGEEFYTDDHYASFREIVP